MIQSSYDAWWLSHLPVMLPVLVLWLAIWGTLLYAAAKILKKAGHSPWWSILAIVPIVNFFAVVIFAFSRWPALDGRDGDA